MGDLKLLPSQTNELFRLIQNNGFDPANFSWTEANSNSDLYESVPMLRHTPTDFYLIFDRIEYHRGESGFLVRCSPGRELKYESIDAGNWNGVVREFSIWLGFLKRETELPDLWNSVEDNQLLQDAGEQPSDNLPFSQLELIQVKESLNEIKAYVLRIKEMSEVQRKIVDARFDHMEEAASRMGRKDWLSLVIGNLLGMAFSIALTGDSTRDLFGFAALVIKRVLGTLLYLNAPH